MHGTLNLALSPQHNYFNKAHPVFLVSPRALPPDAPSLFIFFPGINFFAHQPSQQDRAGVTAQFKLTP
jgi:hypothetical protein